MMVTYPEQVPTFAQLYRQQKLSPAPDGAKPPATLLGPSEMPKPSARLNNTVALIKGDITTMGVDAIVNAANTMLLGGAGVDGAIHRAAGSQLLEECRTLGGCATGSAKMTLAYRLPCARVIHAVGPIYHPAYREQQERELASCYTTSLRLAVHASLRTIAFPALSTGIYSYPAKSAAATALNAVRQFLEGEGAAKIDKVVLVVFDQPMWDVYAQTIPLFFPPAPDGELGEDSEVDDGAKDVLTAEAQAVASVLPDAPTDEPDDSARGGKRQKQEEGPSAA